MGKLGYPYGTGTSFVWDDEEGYFADRRFGKVFEFDASTERHVPAAEAGAACPPKRQYVLGVTRRV